MMSSILTHVLQLLSIFTLLQLQCIGIEAYPITSKPIEWTAENWAWQAWAKQTSEEQSKGKGRKVTPKSIFESPFRNMCPEGHQANGNLCIPTVSIDPKDLINKQVLAIVGDADIGGSNFDFDYGDEFGSILTDSLSMYNTYDEQKFSGGALPLPTSFDNAGQLPSQDAPLKFDFFEQKLSDNENDTMPDNMSYDDEYGMPAPPNNLTTSSIVQKNNTEVLGEGLFLKSNETMDSNLSKVANATTLKNDLVTESSNISNSMSSIDSGGVVTLEFPTAASDFPIEEIEAISLSASLPVRHLTGTIIVEEVDKNTPATHKVSLHKGDSVVHITTASLVTEPETPAIINDKLLNSDEDGGSSTTVVDNERTSTETTFDKTTNDDEKVTLDWFPKETTTYKAVAKEQEILGNGEDSWQQKEKFDHTRSVTESYLMSADELSAQEIHFSTTLEPDETTSFQVDDTTIIEAFNPPTIELQELRVKPAEHQFTANNNNNNNNDVDVVKSKVQPVSEATTTTEASALPLPLPAAALPDSHRLASAIIIDGSDVNAGDSALDVTGNQFNNEGATATTTTLGSSRDANMEPAAASNIIYDLVKGKNDNNYEHEAFTSTTETSAIVETETSSSWNIEEELSNIDMETTTILSDIDNNNSHHVNKNNRAQQQAIVTNADVGGNTNENYDDIGEIVFVVASHKSNNQKRQPSDINVATTTVESGDESYTNENIETASITKRPLTTTTTAAPTTTERISSKRWSKVMPIFDRKTKPSTTEQLVDETTFKIIHETVMAVKPADATTLEKSIKQSKAELTTQSSSTLAPTTITPITEIVTTKSSSISISSDKRSRNVSRRNSKIIRLDKYPLAASVNRLSASSKLIMPPPSPILLSSASSSTTITKDPVRTSEIDTEFSKSSSINLSNSNRSDPFWWLPMGWHLDRHENFDGRPLLLRLWTTFSSNNQAKV